MARNGAQIYGVLGGAAGGRSCKEEAARRNVLRYEDGSEQGTAATHGQPPPRRHWAPHLDQAGRAGPLGRQAQARSANRRRRYSLSATAAAP